MIRRRRIFQTLAEAVRANDDYHARLTPDQCLDVMDKLVQLSRRKSTRRPELKIYQICRTKGSTVIREGGPDFDILRSIEQ